ncbi:aldo/keto reductase [Nonomuraea sp. LP-02]|uniref:aldo/keto reductase n=1 Tax=Nonomuraea sp. LP-02 TaxID=3097960 RepID=UPI002E35E440|nr:aldo/keto reductase [Nonomuraea sp. LP-02]MED7923067.1 aldo/keto reductase [Nonomuraea sp. LP-02]
MDYTRLGGTGLQVSRVCLGMMSYGDPSRQDWALPQDEAEPIIRRAADAGVTFFDTADVYSRGESEVVTGNALRAIFPRREDYVLATKVYFPMSRRPNDGGLSRKHIMAAIDASLRRLGTDHVDLYQIHRWDPETPIEETMEALHDVVRAGKARYLGASSMWAWQFAKAQHVAELNGWTRFVSMQPHYNLLYREEEREMLPLCLDQGVGVIPWSPLARGVLARAGAAASTSRAGSDTRIESLYDPENDKAIVDRVARVAADRGLPAAQVALAWLLHQPAVTAPIVGATKDRHVDDAVAAVDVRLSEEELAFLAEPYRPREVRF